MPSPIALDFLLSAASTLTFRLSTLNAVLPHTVAPKVSSVVVDLVLIVVMSSVRVLNVTSELLLVVKLLVDSSLLEIVVIDKFSLIDMFDAPIKLAVTPPVVLERSRLSALIDPPVISKTSPRKGLTDPLLV